MTPYEATERANRIEHIKGIPTFLDAVFFIYSYNNKFHRSDAPPISADEVFEKYDADEYDVCLNRSEELMGMSSRMGASAYSYEGALPYGEAVQKMKEEHPGFSEECYTEVCWRGQIAMR